ncbi:hypothetical protein HPP92_007213 [Vanilla planifolia]|uniref:Uncharacterized protein n=1 Tax=Vanilla planifolia TaxID=51239 RepID=A0A835RLY3_VANPL|nr:hypothetical protein HPP92_007213 [Vanilla planifolia]
MGEGPPRDNEGSEWGSGRIGFDSLICDVAKLKKFPRGGPPQYMPCLHSNLKRVVYFQEMFGTENFL